MALYDLVDTTDAGGQAIRVLVPNASAAKPYNAANPTGLILYAHGAGEDYTALLADPLKAGCVNALLDAGYILAGTTAHGENWGNQAAVGDYLALAAYVKAHYNVSYVAIWSQSMGGLAGLLTVAQGSLPVVGWLGTYPVCNLANMHTTAFASAIDTAYGVSGDYAAKTAGHDPVLIPAGLYRGLPTRLYASAGDTVVAKSQNTDVFKALIGASARESTVVVCTGDHGDPSHFIPSEYVAFFNRCFADPMVTARFTKLGAICWPWHMASATAGRALDAETQILGPAQHRHLLPYFATETGTNSIAVSNAGQAAMDKMLAMCVACGLDYVSFDYYPDALGYLAPSGGLAVWEGINNALQLYLSSPLRSQIKFTLVLVGDDLGVASPPVAADWPAVQADILSYLVRPEYVRLDDGRPLVYIINPSTFIHWMGDAGTATAKINALRAAANAAGFPGGGICLADMSSGAINLGADCVTNYAEILGAGGMPASYSFMTSQATTNWSQWNADGKYHIPLAGVGWDFRPRVDNTFWSSHVGTDRGLGAIEDTLGPYVDGTATTAQQVANHIKAGFDHVAAHPTFAGPTNTVHVYALDEFSECGNGLLPMKQHGPGDAYLQVIARTLGRQKDSHRALKARGMPIVNRPDRARATY